MPITRIQDRDALNVPAFIWHTGESWADFYARLSAAAPTPAVVYIQGFDDRSIPAGVYDTTGVTFVGTEFNTDAVPAPGGLYPLIFFEDGAQFMRTLRFRNLRVQGEALTTGILAALPASQGADILLDNATLSSAPGAAVNLMDLVPPAAQEHHVYMINNAMMFGDSASSCVFSFAANDVMTMWAYSGSNIGANSFTSALAIGPSIYHDDTVVIDAAAAQGSAIYSNFSQALSGAIVWTSGLVWSTDVYPRIYSGDAKVIFIDDTSVRTIDAGSYDLNGIAFIGLSMDSANNVAQLAFDDGAIFATATSIHFENVFVTFAGSTTPNITVADGLAFFMTAKNCLIQSSSATAPIKFDDSTSPVVDVVDFDGPSTIGDGTNPIFDVGSNRTLKLTDLGSLTVKTGIATSSTTGALSVNYIRATLFDDITSVGAGSLTVAFDQLDIDHLFTVTAGASYTATLDDRVILVNKTIGGATAVSVPGATQAGKDFVITDAKGDALVNNITITAASGNINGAASFAININQASVTIVSDGTDYFVVGGRLI